MMRVVGWCVDCRRITRLHSTLGPFVGDTVAGVCDGCVEAEAKDLALAPVHDGPGLV